MVLILFLLILFFPQQTVCIIPPLILSSALFTHNLATWITIRRLLCFAAGFFAIWAG
ncbi:hypothetical protein HDK77DRAFT_448303 [Phyllosticta capitalensis]